MLYIQSGALPSLNIQILGFKRHLLKKRGFYLQESSVFLIIKKERKKEKPSLLFPMNLLRLPYGPLPFVRHRSLSFLSPRI